MRNTAAPVSLILLGSQTIWAHSELIRRATDASIPSIEDVGIHHRGAYVPVSEQLLDCPDACLCVARRQVVAVFEGMSRRIVAKRVTSCRLGDGDRLLVYPEVRDDLAALAGEAQDRPVKFSVARRSGSPFEGPSIAQVRSMTHTIS